jgi:hypothetical protein
LQCSEQLIRDSGVVGVGCHLPRAQKGLTLVQEQKRGLMLPSESNDRSKNFARFSHPLAVDVRVLYASGRNELL